MTFWQTGVRALGALPTSELIALVAAPAYFIFFLLIFCIRALRHGVPRSARFDRMGRFPTCGVRLTASFGIQAGNSVNSMLPALQTDSKCLIWRR